jgi:hypothetical protein
MLVVLLDCAEQRVSLSLPATARILWQVAGELSGVVGKSVISFPPVLLRQLPAALLLFVAIIIVAEQDSDLSADNPHVTTSLL